MSSNTVTFKINLVLDGKQQVVEASTSVQQLQNALANAQTEATKTRDTLITFNQGVEAIRNISSATQELINNLSNLTANARDFDDALRRTNTLAGKDESGFQQMREQVDELAKQLPIARDALANGLYAVISSDLPEDNWMQMLEQSTKAAIGGQADLERVVSATATVIKNYGMAWEEAGTIQDKIQNTAKVGETTFEEMAAALPRVTASAATLGITLDELMGSFATLTGVSGNTAEVATQLMSVLTALIKPSSEAIKLAQQMGIQFDAAAVKAAGGFQNFLSQLDADISNFSSQTGILREEIYGKLFGNAEALRALIPLTGELRDKFNENVSDMANTAGTLDAAVEQMAQTSDAKAQLMRNQWSAFGDTIHAALGGLLPVVNGAMTAVTTLATTLITAAYAFNTLRSSTVAATIATKAQSVAATAWNTIARFVTGANTAVATSATTAATGLSAMQMALRALLIATGVGAAIAALTAIIAALTNTSEKATLQTNENAEAEQAFTNAAANAKVAIDSEISKLKQLIDKKQDTKLAVDELNQKYGSVFGNHKTAADWYDTLTRKSAIYTQQLGYEAQAKLLASKVAQLDIKLNSNREKQSELKATGADTEYSLKTISSSQYGYTQTVKGPKVKSNAMKALEQQENELTTQLDDYQHQLDFASQKAANLALQLAPTATTNLPPQLTEINTTNNNEQTKQIINNAASLADLTNNLQIYEEQLEHTDATDLNAIDTLMQKKRATEAQIDTIKKLFEAYIASEEYKEPEAEVETDINKLNSIYSLNQAIQALNEQQEKASANEIANIQQQIKAIEKKRDVYLALKDLPDILQLGNYLANLPEAQLQVQLELIGTDTIQDYIQHLKNILNDTPNLNVGDTANIQKALQLWEQYSQKINTSKNSFRQVWGSVKGIGSAIEQLTTTLKDDGNAWQKTSAIIDATLSAFEGIRQLINIINTMLGVNTEQQKANTQQKATAAAVDTATTATEVANSTAKTTASNAEATADVTAAAAKTMKAHASIPWVGIAIGAGMVATLIATMLALPKFANGGIAYGPTLGLFGEYAGASSNPEVVAPLDRLRALLNVNSPDTNAAADVQFRIRGADLLGVLKRRSNFIQRT